MEVNALRWQGRGSQRPDPEDTRVAREEGEHWHPRNPQMGNRHPRPFAAQPSFKRRLLFLTLSPSPLSTLSPICTAQPCTGCLLRGSISSHNNRASSLRCITIASLLHHDHDYNRDDISVAAAIFRSSPWLHFHFLSASGWLQNRMLPPSPWGCVCLSTCTDISSTELLYFRCFVV
jgi:hypothetical protein